MPARVPKPNDDPGSSARMQKPVMPRNLAGSDLAREQPSTDHCPALHLDRQQDCSNQELQIRVADAGACPRLVTLAPSTDHSSESIFDLRLWPQIDPLHPSKLSLICTQNKSLKTPTSNFSLFAFSLASHPLYILLLLLLLILQEGKEARKRKTKGQGKALSLYSLRFPV